LAIVSVALGRTDPTFINNSVMIFPSVAYPVPPMIDATSFINNSAFIDNTFNSLFVTPYATANTVNYTNFGVLGAIEGFRFDTYNTKTARYTNAGNLQHRRLSGVSGPGDEHRQPGHDRYGERQLAEPVGSECESGRRIGEHGRV
jgi:hypothetical protein